MDSTGMIAYSLYILATIIMLIRYFLFIGDDPKKCAKTYFTHAFFLITPTIGLGTCFHIIRKVTQEILAIG